ncbi:MAG: tRNA modification GTPase, partial [Desulfosalsimonadaceae bacterium]
RRAFLNGRMDLTQAEAVMDLIEARSVDEARFAVNQLQGGLKSQIAAIRSNLVDLAALLEAGIDFPEESQEAFVPEELAFRLEGEALEPVRGLIQRYDEGRRKREGLRVVIAGSPNVGKSSLLNCLVGRERAIVTDFPGTTRDVIEDWFYACGVPVTVTDTAGLHDNPEPVEEIGIGKACDALADADLVLFVLDVSQPLQDSHLHFLQRFSAQPMVLVLNKIDLDFRLELPEMVSRLPAVLVSARFHTGLDALRERIAAYDRSNECCSVDAVVPNLRHKQALETCLQAVFAGVDGLRSGRPEEAVVLDLYDAIKSLSEVTGESVRPDILGRVFERFCIGK